MMKCVDPKFLAHAAPEGGDHSAEGVEPDKPAVGLLTGLLVALIIVLVVTGIAASTVLWDFTAQQNDIAVNSQPHEELLKLQERDKTRLTEYGVVDEKAGVYQVPIDRAMEVLVERQTLEAK